MTGIDGIPNSDRLESASEAANSANPIFVHPITRTTFRKYHTDVGFATEDEITTIEYLCSYDIDADGFVWVVSEQGKGVARITKLYVEYFARDFYELPAESYHSYEYDHEAFQSLLQQVRASPQIREEAAIWIQGIREPTQSMAARGPQEGEGRMEGGSLGGRGSVGLYVIKGRDSVKITEVAAAPAQADQQEISVQISNQTIVTSFVAKPRERRINSNAYIASIAFSTSLQLRSHLCNFSNSPVQTRHDRGPMSGLQPQTNHNGVESAPSANIQATLTLEPP